MKLRVNGDLIDLEQPCTVRELLAKYKLEDAACAVEINRRIVPKSQHHEHILNEGDTVELVTLVGGG